MITTNITPGYIDTNSTPTQTSKGTTNECSEVSVFIDYGYAIALLCSIIIITLLSFLERRNNQTRWSRQRPGIIFPINLLDQGDNTYGYAAAFGSMSDTIGYLFSYSIKNSIVPGWSFTLVLFLVVLVVGLLYYPLFACLSTSWTLLGSILGLICSVFWFAFYLKILLACSGEDAEDVLVSTFAASIPILACLSFLILQFAFIFIKRIIWLFRQYRTHQHSGDIKEVRKRLAAEHNVTYVRQLFASMRLNSLVENASDGDTEPSTLQTIKKRILKCMYKNDPTFKYSPRIICIFTVAAICTYQLAVGLVLAGYKLNQSVPSNTNVPHISLFVEVSKDSLFISFILSSLFIVVSIFQILTNYRTNTKRLYKGDFKHIVLGRDKYPPAHILSDSFAYAGSQIAYILWGFIVIFITLFIMCVVLAVLIILPIFNLMPRFFLVSIGNIVIGVVISQSFIRIRPLISRGFLQTRTVTMKSGKTKKKPVLALDNRKLYHNASYFFFILYIIVGLFGCLLTILKGILLGVIYLSRLDRCSLMAGFESWDKGYRFYISFLHLEACHRHPVVLVFCDSLIDSVQKNNLHLINVIEDLELSGSHPGSSRLARNRWLKAYTLIRNPTLQCNKDGTV